MKQTLQRLYVFHLRWHELQSLSRGERALFAVSSFALSEVNVLQRLSLFSLYQVSGNKHVEEAASIQRNVLLRLVTLKLFEFRKLVERSSSSGELSGRCRAIVESKLDDLKRIDDLPGFRIAKLIRNKVVGHYDFEQTIRSVDRCEDDFECSLYLADEAGNSFFPIGEKIVFERLGALPIERERAEADSAAEVQQWIDWTTAVGQCLKDLHFQVFFEVVAPLFDGRKARQRDEWIDPDLVGDHPTFRIPVFLRDAP